MGRMFYEVAASFTDPATAESWQRWMLEEHMAEVLNCGASATRLVRLDESRLTFVAQYEFPSRHALDDYLVRHAPRLRAEGAKRFPPDCVTYTRRTGEIVEK